MECGPSALKQLSTQFNPTSSRWKADVGQTQQMHNLDTSAIDLSSLQTPNTQNLERQMSLQPIPMLGNPMINREWARQFSASNNPINANIPGFEQAFQNAGMASSAQWNSEFQANVGNHVQVEQHFDAAFKQAKESLEWNQEFANANHSWSSEFASQGQMVQKESGDISQTAAVLLDSVKNVTNPKFAKSKFFGLMKKFKDVEAVIEGDQIVDPTSLEKGKGSFEWAKQFSSAINTGNWEESIPDSQDPSWIQQLNVGHPSSINHQLHGDQGSSAWLNEFESQSNLMPQEDWAQSFKEKLNIDPDQDDVAWNNMEKAWEYQGMHQYSADNDIRFSEYNFTANNPYQNYDQYFLTDLKQHESLTESVLALEAAVQKDNLSSALWCELGKKNQENENDAAAISALRKAIQIDPSNLNALLSLSVSYTNENYSSEAYDTLRTWIHTHPSYSHLAPFYNSVISVSEKHDLITSSFMQAAKSNPGQNLDEDVQSALGILFNISTEYTKAIDCFRAAISKRPDDYQLWNKLGATLANSNDPEQAIDSYFNALQINPDYIRARYNLAIACIQIGKYREAGEHLLGALSIQQNDLQHVQAKTNTAVPTNTTESGQSSSLWNTLRLLMETYIRRDDLISACNARDLDAFRKDFQF